MTDLLFGVIPDARFREPYVAREVLELHAGCTWVYAVYANPLIGFDCTLFIAEAGPIEFPTETRP